MSLPVLEEVRAGEELTKCVEGKGHDTVIHPESLLNAITVVAVDIDVEYAREDAEEFQYAENDVIYVAKAAGLSLLRVVQPPGPVDSDFSRPR